VRLNAYLRGTESVTHVLGGVRKAQRAGLTHEEIASIIQRFGISPAYLREETKRRSE
jgi:hypothetical protein